MLASCEPGVVNLPHYLACDLFEREAFQVRGGFICSVWALAEGRPWRDPPVVEESLGGGAHVRKSPTGIRDLSDYCELEISSRNLWAKIGCILTCLRFKGDSNKNKARLKSSPVPSKTKEPLLSNDHFVLVFISEARRR